MNEYSLHSPWVFDIEQSLEFIEKIYLRSEVAQEESTLLGTFMICTALDLHALKSKVAVPLLKIRDITHTHAHIHNLRTAHSHLQVVLCDEHYPQTMASVIV